MSQQVFVAVNPTIVAGAFAELGPIIDGMGGNSDEALSKVDPSLDDLADPDQRISLNAVAELLEIAAREAGNDALALDLAQEYPTGHTGLLGYTMLNARTVRQCCQDVHRYSRLLTPEQKALFQETETGGTLIWEFPESLRLPRNQYIAITASLIVRRIRLAAGPGWTPQRTTLEISRPTNIDPYYSVFGSNISFGTARSLVEVSRETLDLEIPGSDTRLHRLLRELGEYRLSDLEAESDIVDRTQDEIISLLRQGPVSLEMVARDLGQSSRSLQRRLKDEGTSFQVVLEKTRRLLARHYLRTHQHSLTEIAYLLGFSEQSAFTRACRKWFDATPYEMRMRLRQV